MIAALIWALIGTVVLVFIYRHVQQTWPQSYFGPAESVARFFSQTGLRYLLFRFLPPYLVFVAIGLYAPGAGMLPVVLCAIVYGATSTFLSIAASVRGVEHAVPLTIQRMLVLATIIVGIAGCAWAAAVTAPRLRPYAPDAADIVANVMAAALAAVLIASFLMSTRSVGPDRRGFPHELSSQIEAIAVENNVDPTLAVAIGYVESQQRPPWFRRLERLSARIRSNGSYGLFQVKNHGPVGDVESCRIALKRIQGVYPLLDSEHRGVPWSVRQCAEAHNPDARFANMIVAAYEQMSCYPRQQSNNHAPDLRPLLDLWSIGRFGDRMRARGTVWAATERVVVETHTLVDPAWSEVPTVVVAGAAGRSSWHADLKGDAVQVQIRTVSMLDGCFTGEAMVLDLRDAWLVTRDITLAP